MEEEGKDEWGEGREVRVVGRIWRLRRGGEVG